MYEQIIIKYYIPDSVAGDDRNEKEKEKGEGLIGDADKVETSK